MIFNKLYLIPPILFFLLLGCIIITYVVSVTLDHVRPLFPYISDTGTTPPESTIFSQILNIGAIIIYITFYIRCKQVKTLYSDPNLPHYTIVARINQISLWISLPVALGTSITGNFQETNAFVPHIIGAFLSFTLALVYFLLHTIISYITCPIMNTMNMTRLRVFLTISSSLSCGGTGLFGVISYFEFIKKNTIADLPKWGPDDGAFELHIISTILEWITFILYGCYILTFIKDFKNVVLQSPKMEKLNHINFQIPDIDTNNVNIHSLDNMNRRVMDEDNNGNFGKAVDVGRGGSKILLV